MNEKLPEGNVTEDQIGKWLRDALADQGVAPRPLAEPPAPTGVPTEQAPSLAGPEADSEPEPTGDASDPERHRMRRKFWSGLLPRAAAKTPLHANISPGKIAWVGAGCGVRGLTFNYVIRQQDGTVELWINRGAKETNKDLFDWLNKRKGEIEHAFGGELSWQRLNEKQSCRIAYNTVGGWKSDESKWPDIQEAMIAAMIRLEKALRPQIDALNKDVLSQSG